MNPHQLAEKRVQLSALYSNATEQLKDVLSEKPTVWQEIRKTVKSDTAAERAWEATELGIKEMRLRLSLKAMEKEMSSISTMLKVLDGEARNQW